MLALNFVALVTDTQWDSFEAIKTVAKIDISEEKFNYMDRGTVLLSIFLVEFEKASKTDKNKELLENVIKSTRKINSITVKELAETLEIQKNIVSI